MGTARRSGSRTPSFIDALLDAIGAYYGEVLQHLTAYVPPAPKLERTPKSAEDKAPGIVLARDQPPDFMEWWSLSRPQTSE